MSNSAIAETDNHANENTANESDMSDEQKRQAIRERIEAGEANLQRRQERTFADQVGDAKDAAVDFTRRHPLSVVAGALVAGVAVSAMFKNSPTRRLGRRGAAIAAIAAESALEYGQQALYAASEAGRSGLETLDDLGDYAGDEGRSLRRTANYKAAGALDRTRIAGRGAIKGSRRSMERTKRKLTR